MHQAVHDTFGLAKTEFSYCRTAGEKLGAEVSLDYLTVPIMLMRNLNASKGLCNGTRLIVTQLTRRVIEGVIIQERLGDARLTYQG